MQNGILRQPSPVKITGPCCEIQIQSIVAFTAFKSLKTASLLKYFPELRIKMWRIKDVKTHLRNKEANRLPNVEISRMTSLSAVKFHTRVPVCFRRESVKPNTENSLSALFVPFQHTRLCLSVQCVGVYRVELWRSQHSQQDWKFSQRPEGELQRYEIRREHSRIVAITLQTFLRICHLN